MRRAVRTIRACSIGRYTRPSMMNEWILRATCALCALFLFGCDGHPMIIMKMDLEEGALTSSENKVALRLRAERPYKILGSHRLGASSNRASHIIAHGHNEEFEIAIKISPSRFSSSELLVAFAGKMLDSKSVEIRDAQYYYNDASAQTLVFNDGSWYRSERIDYTFKNYELTLPRELLAHPIREHGDGILNPEEFASQLELERYRFVIDLLVNDEPYTLDMTCRFRLGKGTRFGIPAMP